MPLQPCDELRPCCDHFVPCCWDEAARSLMYYQLVKPWGGGGLIVWHQQRGREEWVREEGKQNESSVLDGKLPYNEDRVSFYCWHMHSHSHALSLTHTLPHMHSHTHMCMHTIHVSQVFIVERTACLFLNENMRQFFSCFYQNVLSVICNHLQVLPIKWSNDYNV